MDIFIYINTLDSLLLYSWSMDGWMDGMVGLGVKRVSGWRIRRKTFLFASSSYSAFISFLIWNNIFHFFSHSFPQYGPRSRSAVVSWKRNGGKKNKGRIPLQCLWAKFSQARLFGCYQFHFSSSSYIYFSLSLSLPINSYCLLYLFIDYYWLLLHIIIIIIDIGPLVWAC